MKNINKDSTMNGREQNRANQELTKQRHWQQQTYTGQRQTKHKTTQTIAGSMNPTASITDNTTFCRIKILVVHCLLVKNVDKI